MVFSDCHNVILQNMASALLASRDSAALLSVAKVCYASAP